MTVSESNKSIDYLNLAEQLLSKPLLGTEWADQNNCGLLYRWQVETANVYSQIALIKAILLLIETLNKLTAKDIAPPLLPELINEIPCPGYIHMGYGEYLGLHEYYIDCPELKRQAGHRPGTDKGYPQNWDMKCPTCHNKGTVPAGTQRVEGSSEYRWP